MFKNIKILVAPEWEEADCDVAQGDFLGNYSALDWGVGYTGLCIVKTRQTVQLKFVHSTVCKLYFNLKEKGCLHLYLICELDFVFIKSI